MKRLARSLSLAELAVTIGVAVVLLTGIFSMMTSSAQSRNFTKERALALEVARSKLELINEMSMTGQFTSIPALDNTEFPAPDPADYPSGIPLDLNPLTSGVAGEQAGKITVTDSGLATASGLLKVQVEVRWRSGDSTSNVNRVTLVNYVSDRTAP